MNANTQITVLKFATDDPFTRISEANWDDDSVTFTSVIVEHLNPHTGSWMTDGDTEVCLQHPVDDDVRSYHVCAAVEQLATPYMQGLKMEWLLRYFSRNYIPREQW